MKSNTFRPIDLIQLHPICRTSLTPTFVNKRRLSKSQYSQVYSDHAFLIDEMDTDDRTQKHTMTLSYKGYQLCKMYDTFLTCIQYATRILSYGCGGKILQIDDDEILIYRNQASDVNLNNNVIPRVFRTEDGLAVTDGCKRICGISNSDMITDHSLRPVDADKVNLGIMIMHEQILRDLSFSLRNGATCRAVRRTI